MPLYEHVYIARQEISPQQVDTLTENLKSVIEDGGGKIGKTEYWGLKTLAYRIKKNRKGHYSLMNIDAPPAAIAEMERQMRLNEDVLRFKTFRVEEHETGESVQMRKGGPRGGRGDRGDRGDRSFRDSKRPPRDDKKDTGDKGDAS